METIKAQVSERLLTKASRLFTGTLEGRIIEILQNSRRAGATQVNIMNKDGFVTVCDNGSGIKDFSKLLSLGDSDWDDSMEKAEDPAGVGIFCLAPREVTICRGKRKVFMTEKAWTGEPIPVLENTDSIKRTILIFKDELWEFATVETQAVFTGLIVTVAGEDEIMYQIYRLRKQNQIIASEKIQPIVDFAVENVLFPGCNHPLLKQFCPANKCFMAELVNEYKNTHLFEKV